MRANPTLAALDRLLAHAERATALIDRCRPTNALAELSRVTERWEAGDLVTPMWQHGAPPDLRSLRCALEQAAVAVSASGPIGALYAGRARELSQEAAIVEALGAPAFRSIAAARFPLDTSRDGSLADASARKWAALDPPDDGPQVAAEDLRDPRSLVSSLQALIGSLRLPVRVVLASGLASGAATGDGIILVRSGVALGAASARRIALHEVVGHALPRIRARDEQLGLFRVGTAAGADDEEGRALLIEERHGLLDDARRRELGVRHLAAAAVRQGADWVDIVRMVRSYGFGTADAVRLAARINRGGGLAREVVYLPALYRLRAALSEDPGLERWLERGRISTASARSLRSLSSTDFSPEIYSNVGIAGA